MKISIHRDVVDSLIEYATDAHPKESFAYLKGRVGKDTLVVEQAYYHPILTTKRSVEILPSLETHTQGLIGTAHSHPGSDLRPSKADLHVFSKFPVNIILDREKLVVFDSHGKQVPYSIVYAKKQEDEIDRLHAKIFYEAINEREKWVSSYQSGVMLIIFAAIILIMLVIYSIT